MRKQLVIGVLAGISWGAGLCNLPVAYATVPATATRAAIAKTAPSESQVALLDLAMEAASAIPIEPHIKDRSRAQQAVVEACLEINALTQAVRFTEDVKDWRRGICYAGLAIYEARHTQSVAALKHLEKAEQISKAQGLEEWRRDMIIVKIAQAHVMLGNDAQAVKAAAGLAPADAGKVEGARAMTGDDQSYEEKFKLFKSLAANKNFDIANSGLQSSLMLYAHFYGNAERRTELEKMIHEHWTPVPIFQRIELQLKMCDTALAAEDRAHALELVTEAEAIKAAAKWPIEYEVPLIARLAEYRHRAGDRSAAAAALAGALAKYDANKKLMLNIEYVGALLPVAEAYLAIADHNDARSIYQKATEESIVNPNSRPRALDLAALCRSMALRGFTPDAALWERLREIRKGLSDPW